ncbi:cation:proton antiporter family protein [Dasania marina]|uniref:cation:proton antiporter family protein n=1 Tax=Dasania marina TaxID=471499 RepID=UPI0030DA783D|tara:strand:+ start:4682 stop:6271 length:1590 start_codon:yes stop_codon:yes gene_type:complete
MDFIWILIAFICGLSLKLTGLPPLIGYLIAGFILNAVGIEPSPSLNTLADLGITLMLFTIGLKINLRDLLSRETWAGSLSHMGLWLIVVSSIIIFMTALTVPYFTELSHSAALLLAFAFSFSSTVCVVKLLEENGELKTRHGKLAVGVLIMQDIVAVIFLAVSAGKAPSIFALGLVGLFFIRPLIDRLLNNIGHSELLPLTGFCLAIGGYQLFEFLQLKGDLGALLVGMLLSHHAAASELNKSLMNFRDLFLIGFFLSIGFIALPTPGMMAMAGLICLLLSLKFLLFFAVFIRLKLRGRTAYLTALALSNFSEFGLIVMALGADAQWINPEWLVILALATSLSFVLTTVLYRGAHSFYRKHNLLIKSFQSAKRLPSDRFIQPHNAEVLVIGLGRVGKGAYRALHNVLGNKVWGMDADRMRVHALKKEGFHAISADGEDADFWESIDLSKVELILLSLPTIEDSGNVTQQLKAVNYQGQIAAIARYEDEQQKLLNHGIDKVFNFFTEAGAGFAEESLAMLSKQNSPKPTR